MAENVTHSLADINSIAEKLEKNFTGDGTDSDAISHTREAAMDSAAFEKLSGIAVRTVDKLSGGNSFFKLEDFNIKVCTGLNLTLFCDLPMSSYLNYLVSDTTVKTGVCFRLQPY